jgi:hypothetical protein
LLLDSSASSAEKRLVKLSTKVPLSRENVAGATAEPLVTSIEPEAVCAFINPEIVTVGRHEYSTCTKTVRHSHAHRQPKQATFPAKAKSRKEAARNGSRGSRHLAQGMQQ